jgi:glycosyltransferase involved in cell wall biosynthesis
MVGTVEPRKGYEQAVSAFKTLWRDELNAPQLLVIGRGGWKTHRLQQNLRQLSERDDRFRWIECASDEFLENVYERVTGLLVASEGEGFGLPIVEALAHGRPVLARDLPVFRELQGPGVCYFDGGSSARLGEALRGWLRGIMARPPLAGGKTATWDEAAAGLASLLLPTGRARDRRSRIAREDLGSPFDRESFR